MMSARERLVRGLKSIYWGALGVSLISLLGQAIAAPLNPKIPLGPILFICLSIFCPYLIRNLDKRYCVELDKYTVFNFIVVFRLLFGVTAIVLGFLDMLLVPIA